MTEDEIRVVVENAAKQLKELERNCLHCGELFYADEHILERVRRLPGGDVRVCDACVLEMIERGGREAEEWFRRREIRVRRMARKRRRGWA
jgi:predicted nuclease with RNAse H fold